jgi:hypothetical protein
MGPAGLGCGRVVKRELVSAMDLRDPYAVADFIEENEQRKAELQVDIAARQERSAAGLDREWRPAQAESAPAAVRAPNGPQTHTREWTAWLTREVEARVAARVDALRIECADVIADLAREYDQKLVDVERRLRAESGARLQGVLAGFRMSNGVTEPDVVLDMGKALRPRHDA